MTYEANCGEDVVTIEIAASDSARIFVNGAEHDAVSSVMLTGQSTVIAIAVESASGVTVNEYQLTVSAPLSDARLYFQRWDNVLAINHNPATNGGYTVTGVRWYKNDELVSNEQFIRYDGGAYRAEVAINGVWQRICPFVSTRATSVVAWPNPVSRGESLTLQLPETFVGGTLSIYSVAGTLVKTGVTLPTTLSNVRVDDLPAGIYLFRVNSINGNSETVKIVISD
jgi:hypothetical protein